jgi:hypothetical protein
VALAVVVQEVQTELVLQVYRELPIRAVAVVVVHLRVQIAVMVGLVVQVLSFCVMQTRDQLLLELV